MESRDLIIIKLTGPMLVTLHIGKEKIGYQLLQVPKLREEVVNHYMIQLIKQ